MNPTFPGPWKLGKHLHERRENRRQRQARRLPLQGEVPRPRRSCPGVTAFGRTKTGAERALQAKLQDRAKANQSGELTAMHKINHLLDLCEKRFEGLVADAKRSPDIARHLPARHQEPHPPCSRRASHRRSHHVDGCVVWQIRGRAAAGRRARGVHRRRAGALQAGLVDRGGVELVDVLDRVAVRVGRLGPHPRLQVSPCTSTTRSRPVPRRPPRRSSPRPQARLAAGSTSARCTGRPGLRWHRTASRRSRLPRSPPSTPTRRWGR